MKCSEPIDNLLHIHFEKQYDLVSTFLRFQEFYESPRFRGQIFTTDDFKVWYTNNSPHGKETGEYDFHEKANGFNVPSTFLKAFYDGRFDPLNEHEKSLLDLLSERIRLPSKIESSQRIESPYKKSTKCYIVGTFGDNDQEVLTHEIAHGMFYLFDDYKQQTIEIVDTIPREEKIKIYNLFNFSLYYHGSVFDDELHAHLLTRFPHIEEDDTLKDMLNTKIIRPFWEEMRDNFIQYYSQNTNIPNLLKLE